MPDDIFVARESAIVHFNGAAVTLAAGRTTARKGHPILNGREALFEPLRVDFDLGQADDSDADEPDAPKADEPKVDAKVVRAWAAEQGIDVPARGKLPADLVERYQAAHAEG